MSRLPRPPRAAGLLTPLISEPRFEDGPHSSEGKEAASQLRPQECTFMGYCKKPQLQEWVTKMLTRSSTGKGGTAALSGGGTPEELLSRLCGFWKLNFSLSDLLCQWCRCEAAIQCWKQSRAGGARPLLALQKLKLRGREPSASSHVQ